MRKNIREALISQLGHPDINVIKAAATCVATIGVIDIPSNEWPDLIDTLTKYGTSDLPNIRLASI